MNKETENNDDDVAVEDGDACASSCTKSDSEKMSMRNACELQYRTCIDTYTHTHTHTQM